MDINKVAEDEKKNSTDISSSIEEVTFNDSKHDIASSSSKASAASNGAEGDTTGIFPSGCYDHGVTEEFVSFSQYLWSELCKGYKPLTDADAFETKQARVSNFIQVPKETETFMFYGMLQCFDSFLFMFTFLPLRLIIFFTRLLCNPRSLLNLRSISVFQRCDIAKAFLLISGCLFLYRIDVSMVYHIIRGQAIIKLYIFFGLLEICDKLLSSFGQDIIGTFMWAIAERRHSYIEAIFKFFASTLYVFVHAVVVLLQATTLNVAFNSHNKALLTIVMSNNAVEVKGSVYKRFEKTNLFQMACNDIRERFHLVVLTFIVVVRNMADSNWDIAQLESIYLDVILLFVSEVGVDITKHAFITKFNSINADIFSLYKCILAKDVIDAHKHNAYSDASDQVSKRIGLCPIPTACLLIKIVCESMRVESVLSVINIFLLLVSMLLAKVLLGLVVHGWAVQYINKYWQDHPQSQKAPSGLDEDLLSCVNNLHWKAKSPNGPSYTNSSSGTRKT